MLRRLAIVSGLAITSILGLATMAVLSVNLATPGVRPSSDLLTYWARPGPRRRKQARRSDEVMETRCTWTGMAEADNHLHR